MQQANKKVNILRVILDNGFMIYDFKGRKYLGIKKVFKSLEICIFGI